MKYLFNIYLNPFKGLIYYIFFQTREITNFIFRTKWDYQKTLLTFVYTFLLWFYYKQLIILLQRLYDYQPALTILIYSVFMIIFFLTPIFLINIIINKYKTNNLKRRLFIKFNLLNWLYFNFYFIKSMIQFFAWLICLGKRPANPKIVILGLPEHNSVADFFSMSFALFILLWLFLLFVNHILKQLLAIQIEDTETIRRARKFIGPFGDSYIVGIENLALNFKLFKINKPYLIVNTNFLRQDEYWLFNIFKINNKHLNRLLNTIILIFHVVFIHFIYSQLWNK
jgi:hypothetical protein